MAPHQQRVIDERDELSGRVVKLVAFLSNPVFASLGSAEQGRLTRQLGIMHDYLSVLDERIAAF